MEEPISLTRSNLSRALAAVTLSSDLADTVRLDLVREAVDRRVLGPGMAPDPGDLRADVVLEIVECTKRQINVDTGPGRDLPADRVVAEGEHAAAGVSDDDHLLGPEELLADHQWPDRIVGCEAAGTADMWASPMRRPSRS